MINRRRFFLLTAGALGACAKPQRTTLTGKERVDRALAGQRSDRPPFTFYYHFGLEKLPGERHARATLNFHDKFNTDLVKVMSDFPYPKPAGKWFKLRVEENPFPQQIVALELIRDGLQSKSYFIETIFNSWNQAEKLSSKEEVLRLKDEDPQALLDALEVIAQSQAHHAKRAVEAGAAGIFLAIANAQDGVLSRGDYAKFSEPFDKMILEAVPGAPLNTLHLHGDRSYLDLFQSGWRANVIQYSMHGTAVPFDHFREDYSGVLMGGLDERNFRNLSQAQMKEQWTVAQEAAGGKFILAPGCSVPNETTDQELMRLVNLLAG
jgi:uroporphyrinogen decarboxylase